MHKACRFLIKSLCLIGLYTLLSQQLFAQQTFEGRIEYEMVFETGPKFMRNKPAQVIAYYKNNNRRIETTSNYGTANKSTFIFNCTKGEYLYYSSESATPVLKNTQNNEMSDFKADKNDTKLIDNTTCYKVSFYLKANGITQAYEAYVNDQFQYAEGGYNCNMLPFVMYEYKINADPQNANIVTSYKLKSISPGPQFDQLFNTTLAAGKDVTDQRTKIGGKTNAAAPITFTEDAILSDGNAIGSYKISRAPGSSESDYQINNLKSVTVAYINISAPSGYGEIDLTIRCKSKSGEPIVQKLKTNDSGRGNKNILPAIRWLIEKEYL